jgi:hypothetical protein
MKNTLDIIIDSLSDEEWNELRLKVDAKKAFEKAKGYKAKRESAIGFADWILEQNVAAGYDQNGLPRWVVADGEGNTYTSLELFNIYIRGDWDEYDDEEDDLDDSL